MKLDGEKYDFITLKKGKKQLFAEPFRKVIAL